MDIIDAISVARPNSPFVSTDGTLDGVILKANTPKPTQAEVDAGWAQHVINRDAAARIAVLELEVTPRRLREHTLGTDGGLLVNQEILIEAERANL